MSKQKQQQSTTPTHHQRSNIFKFIITLFVIIFLNGKKQIYKFKIYTEQQVNSISYHLLEAGFPLLRYGLLQPKWWENPENEIDDGI